MRRSGRPSNIEGTLDDELPDQYNRAPFNQKCIALYQHIYDNYTGTGSTCTLISDN